uniref:Uncharacterized protein n=1 Tax=Arundo donax TaxID=35708 RepID=A0A0A9CY96_ARUDO
MLVALSQSPVVRLLKLAAMLP